MKVPIYLLLLTILHISFCATILNHKVLQRDNTGTFNPVSDEINNSQNNTTNGITAVESSREKETCDPADNKCSFGTECVVRDGKGFCVCPYGLTGDFCQVITECELGGMYENCTDNGSHCTFLLGKAVCHCEEGKEFDDRTSKCRKICGQSDNYCEFDSPCEEQDDGHKFCTCPDGLTGDMCEVITECEPGGMYEKCNEAGGTCNFRLGSSFCFCGGSREFDVSTGKCRVTCLRRYSCRHSTACERQDMYDFCTCPEGLKGDLCQYITDCESGGKYSNCTSTGGECKFANGTSSCDCGRSRKFDAKTTRCQEIRSTTDDEDISRITTPTMDPVIDCDCGVKSYNCVMRGFDGEKTCLCHAGYVQLKGMCNECNCGKNSKLCYFDRSSDRSCICSDGYAERNRTCTGICLNSADCKNGGACRIGEGEVPFCTCRYPFAGEWCEVNTECVKLDCAAIGAECTVRGDKAKCECPTWKWYNEDFRRCEGYSKLWIVPMALFSIFGLLMISFVCYCIFRRRREKK